MVSRMELYASGNDVMTTEVLQQLRTRVQTNAVMINNEFACQQAFDHL